MPMEISTRHTSTTQKTEKLTNPATQRCVIAAAEGWVGASRARSPCSNTRIIYYVVILALSAGATSPTVLATKRTNSRAEVPTENAKENSPISHATRMEQGSGSPPKISPNPSPKKGQKEPAPKKNKEANCLGRGETHADRR